MIEMTIPDTEPRYLLSRSQFILLSVATYGTYPFWWIFKSWRFFRDREQSSIHSAIRTQLSLLYLIPLLRRIKVLASDSGYAGSFSPVLLFLLFGLINLPSFLPEPFSLVSAFSFYPLLPPFKALNFAIRKTEGSQAQVQLSFNRRQLILVIAGCFVWATILWGAIGRLLPAFPTE